MKIISRVMLGLAAVCFSTVALANTERTDQLGIPNPELRPMAFDQCVDAIRNHANEVGAPLVVLDTPGLRIVEFKTSTENEQVSCDGGVGIMTLFELDDD